MSALQGEYSLRAAARLLGIHRETLARWIRDGRVAARRVVTGRVYIAADELVRLEPALATLTDRPPVAPSVPAIRDATAATLSQLFGTPMPHPNARDVRRGPR